VREVTANHCVRRGVTGWLGWGLLAKLDGVVSRGMSAGICADPALRGHHSATTIPSAGSFVTTASQIPSILAQTSALIENVDGRLTRDALRNGSNTGNRDACLWLSRLLFHALDSSIRQGVFHHASGASLLGSFSPAVIGHMQRYFKKIGAGFTRAVPANACAKNSVQLCTLVWGWQVSCGTIW
jgi:hypothetical protein